MNWKTVGLMLLVVVVYDRFLKTQIDAILPPN